MRPPADAGTARGADPLTGLANRVSLEAFLAARDAQPASGPLSLMAVEMSRFGSVTDSMGAELGNRIIATVARRLQKIFVHAALIARTHGDHFCLVFEGDIDLDAQIALLQDFTQRPLALRGEVIVMSVRLGIAVLGQRVETPGKLLHAAEVALHRAKREKVRLCFYERDLESEARATHQLENDLRVSLVTRHVELHRAITSDEFRIAYQPIIDVASRRVHALEALIRWHHPQRGIIAPADFIPMAEQIQVMDVLGNWIMRCACADVVTLPANADGTRPGVSINVSPTQFAQPALLLDTVRQSLSHSGIDPARVKLEITESTAFGPDMRSVIERLRALGCSVALDDFGTGYSSLTQLNSIPLDYLKLDRSFIAQIGSEDAAEERRSERMTRAVLSIARDFDLIPIVEGVETAVQRDRLLQHGARLMQGNFFSLPLALEDARRFITRFNLPAAAAEHA